LSPCLSLSQAGDMADQPCPLGSTELKSRLRKALKELSLLKLLKHTNRRILRLHAVAVRCWRSLVAQRSPSLPPAPRGIWHLMPEPEEAAGSPVTSSTSSMDVLMDPETETLLGGPQLLSESWGAGEAKQDLLGTLPQRFHMPAPKVLCRPSAQRWVKPCCTRSCGESLEHVLTVRYLR
ncbi:T53G5 protein, partial [Chauna torquata]|nr:T53G5 protein [Chauna torquata]